MMNIRSLILYLFFISTGIINFTIAPGSKVSLSFYILALIVFFRCNSLFNKLTLNYVDVVFILFLFFVSVGNIYNVDIKSITQPLNFFLFWLFFKFSCVYFLDTGLSRQQLLNVYYYSITFLALLSLMMFVCSFYYPAIIRLVITFFNNANAFDLGGISIGREVAIPRNTGLSPEPSFWSSLIAINLAVFYEIKKSSKHYFLFIINLVALVLTFGRTGYFVFLFFLVFTLLKNSSIFIRNLIFFLISISIVYYWYDIIKYFSEDLSAIQRFDSLFFAFQMWLEKPILGHGLGSFERISLEHGKDYRDIFSLYFNILFSGGIISLLLFIVFLCNNLRKLSAPISLSILSLFLFMPAYNLTFVWILLAVNMIDKKVICIK